MSDQDRPRKGSSGNAETVSGHAGTSGGSGVSQDLSVAESADRPRKDIHPHAPGPIYAMLLDLADEVEPLKRANAELTAERDRARDLAVALEAELGRVQALHAGDGKDKSTFAWRVDVTPGGGIALGERAWKWCPECRTEWPCPTTLAISSQA